MKVVPTSYTSVEVTVYTVCFSNVTSDVGSTCILSTCMAHLLAYHTYLFATDFDRRLKAALLYFILQYFIVYSAVE